MSTDALRDALTLSIVSHGHGALVERLLAQLDALRSLRGVTLLLTLNLAGEQVDVSHCRQLKVKVLRNPAPKGFGANHNAAFTQCTTPWFVVMNPDLSMTHGDVFSVLLEHARQGHHQAIAPLILNSSGGQEDSVRANLTPASLFRRQAMGRRRTAVASGPSGPGRPFYWLAGMFLMIDSIAYRSLGGFDERFFLYCEDYDLCARLYVGGHSYLSDASCAVVHDAQRDSHRSWRHLRWHLGGLLKVWLSRPFWAIALSSPSAQSANSVTG